CARVSYYFRGTLIDYW
nr:immunoglobulin heavy chain junction region [Macaca mulatta]